MTKTYRLDDTSKIDVVLVVVLILVLLLIIDFIDINEAFGFPVNILDEPLLIVFGIILGYLVAKFRFMKIVRKAIR